MTKGPEFNGRYFYSVRDWPAFNTHIQGLYGSVNDGCGWFMGDNLVTWGKSLGWWKDKDLIDSLNTHLSDIREKSIVWRTVTLAWAVRQALRVEGDFAECGCYQGTTARVLFDVAKLRDSDRRFFLYDLFQNAVGIARHAMPNHGPALEAYVRARFAEFPNVIITAGPVPDAFTKACPDQIAFLHVDMNNVAAEIGALEVLFDKVSPGGIVILDDYGWIAYRDQMEQIQAWFATRGYPVLELPTGQGMVLR